MDIIDDISAFFKELDSPGYFLVDIKALPAERIMIYADNHKGITIDECSALHRRLIEKITSAGEYEITVSSPGLDQPFKVAEQYNKNMGKNVTVLTTDGKKYNGRLTSFTDGNITVEEQKKSGIVTHTLNLHNIKSTQLSISFNKIITQ
ncbi:MAG: ribosome maturation factor RimP [Bacteroidia bacterium]